MPELSKQKVASLRSELLSYGFSAPKTMKKKELLSKLTELREQVDVKPVSDDISLPIASHPKSYPINETSSPKEYCLNEETLEEGEKFPLTSWDKQVDSEKEFEPSQSIQEEVDLSAPPSEDALINAERIEYRANRFGSADKSLLPGLPSEPLSLDELLSNHSFSYRRNSKYNRKQTADQLDIIRERRLMRFGTGTSPGTVLTLEQIQREEEKLKRREERFGLLTTVKRRAPID